MLYKLYHCTFFWWLFSFSLLFLDYFLLSFIKKKNPESENIYYKINLNLGSYKMLIVRVIYFIIIFFNFMGKGSVYKENGKTIVLIYFVIVCTLFYDSLKLNKK